MKTHKKQVTGPNENSQKASISVNVLAANSQDEVYEGTTRPRPGSDKQTRKLDNEMNDLETEEKSITLRYWRQESNQSKMWYHNNNDPDWVSNGKQTARKCFQEGRNALLCTVLQIIKISLDFGQNLPEFCSEVRKAENEDGKRK